MLARCTPGCRLRTNLKRARNDDETPAREAPCGGCKRSYASVLVLVRSAHRGRHASLPPPPPPPPRSGQAVAQPGLRWGVACAAASCRAVTARFGGLGRGCPPPGPNPQESPGNQRHVQGAPSSEWPANRRVFGLGRSTLKIVVSPVRIWVWPCEGVVRTGELHRSECTNLSAKASSRPRIQRRVVMTPTEASGNPLAYHMQAHCDRVALPLRKPKR